MNYFTDTHAHLYSENFSEDIENVMQRAADNGVNRIVSASTSLENHADNRDFALKYPDMVFAAYGLHPTEINGDTNLEDELRAVERAITDYPTKCYAVGEIGLDLYWSSEFVEMQKEALHRQIAIAQRHNLPVIIHCRDAYAMMIEELERYSGGLKGVFHSFSGTAQEYHKILTLGEFYFGIGGVVTYKNSVLPSVVDVIDINRILLETDAPYLPPVPYRGKRNESAYVPIIALKVAEIKGVTLEELSLVTQSNAESLFGI